MLIYYQQCFVLRLRYKQIVYAVFLIVNILLLTVFVLNNFKNGSAENYVLPAEAKSVTLSELRPYEALNAKQLYHIGADIFGYSLDTRYNPTLAITLLQQSIRLDKGKTPITPIAAYHVGRLVRDHFPHTRKNTEIALGWVRTCLARDHANPVCGILLKELLESI